jgi:hypothetical protein
VKHKDGLLMTENGVGRRVHGTSGKGRVKDLDDHHHGNKSTNYITVHTVSNVTSLAQPSSLMVIRFVSIRTVMQRESTIRLHSHPSNQVMTSSQCPVGRQVAGM